MGANVSEELLEENNSLVPGASQKRSIFAKAKS
jgi:hypothetical protein